MACVVHHCTVLVLSSRGSQIRADLKHGACPSASLNGALEARHQASRDNFRSSFVPRLFPTRGQDGGVHRWRLIGLVPCSRGRNWLTVRRAQPSRKVQLPHPLQSGHLASSLILMRWSHNDY